MNIQSRQLALVQMNQTIDYSYVETPVSSIRANMSQVTVGSIICALKLCPHAVPSLQTQRGVVEGSRRISCLIAHDLLPRCCCRPYHGFLLPTGVCPLTSMARLPGAAHPCRCAALVLHPALFVLLPSKFDMRAIINLFFCLVN